MRSERRHEGVPDYRPGRSAGLRFDLRASRISGSPLGLVSKKPGALHPMGTRKDKQMNVKPTPRPRRPVLRHKPDWSSVLKLLPLAAVVIADVALAAPGGVFITGHDPDFHAHVGHNAVGAQHSTQRAGYYGHSGKES